MYNSETRPLIIGLDFDDTVTKNFNMFTEIIEVLRKHGCDVYIVTARQENGWCNELRNFSEINEIKVIFTGTRAKHEVAEIDIWIDDFPLGITHDFKEYGWRASETTKKDII